MTQITYNNITSGPRQIGPSVQEGEMAVPSLLVGKRPALPIDRYAPIITTPPLLQGQGVIPSTLELFVGVYDASPMPGTSYKWFRNGIEFANPFPFYTTKPSDDGAQFTVQVTATSVSGTIITTTNTITAVLYENVMLSEYETYGISGMGVVNNKLVADIGVYFVTGMAQPSTQINAEFATYAISGMGQPNIFIVSDIETYTITEGV